MKLSNTAIEQYIRCPRQYHLERHEGQKNEPSQAMLMGRVVHRTIDKMLKKHKKNGRPDYMDINDATDIYSKQWAVEAGLHDKERFTQGLGQIHDWIGQMGVINPDSILATEEWFSLQLEDDLEIVGVIDLITGQDIIDDETGEVSTIIEVWDWKTSAGFTPPSEAHDSLQLSIYIMAAKQLYPVAIKFKAGLYMLNDGTHLPTGRSDLDLAEDYLFVRAMATRIKQETEWAPILNSSCIYCHLRRECPAYQDALTGPMPTTVEVEDYENLEALAIEREAVALREKAAKKRKDEISDILKNHLKGTEGMELGEHFYRLSQTPRKSYPPLETIRILTKHMKMSEKNAIESVCTIANTKLHALIKKEQTTESRMTGAALANIMQTTYSSRLNAKKLKPHRKGK